MFISLYTIYHFSKAYLRLFFRLQTLSIAGQLLTYKYTWSSTDGLKFLISRFFPCEWAWCGNDNKIQTLRAIQIVELHLSTHWIWVALKSLNLLWSYLLPLYVTKRFFFFKNFPQIYIFINWSWNWNFQSNYFLKI